MSHDFPIHTFRMVGSDILKKNIGLMCTKNDVIILYDIKKPLLKLLLFKIPAKTRQNSYAHFYELGIIFLEIISHIKVKTYS